MTTHSNPPKPTPYLPKRKPKWSDRIVPRDELGEEVESQSHAIEDVLEQEAQRVFTLSGLEARMLFEAELERSRKSSIKPLFTHDELLQVVTVYLGDPQFARTFCDCMAIIRAKNADYSQGEQKGDRIAAFRRISRDIDLPIEKAWAVFCQKQWGAIMKYVKSGVLESEPIEERIKDVVNYMVLLMEIVREKRLAEVPK